MSSVTTDRAAESIPVLDYTRPGREAEHLRDLSPEQWKSGIAAWLGWFFDGLDTCTCIRWSPGRL